MGGAMEEFMPGELFVYEKAPGVYELGQVKSKARDGAYFCWYHTGDTAACTPSARMRKLANAGWSRIEGVVGRLGYWLSEEADMCSLANAELGNDAGLDWNHGYLAGQAKAYRSVLRKLDEIGG